MDTIELEIQEIEELIGLQRRKVDLLRKKNELLMRDMTAGGSSGSNATGKEDRTWSAAAAAGAGEREESLSTSTINPLSCDTAKAGHSEQFEIGNGVDNDINHNRHNDRASIVSKIRESIVGPGEDHNTNSNNNRPSFISIIRESIIGPNAKKQKEQEEADERAAAEKEKEDKKNPVSFVDALTRLSRLSTDLANERNLLAWGRTALAAARTCLAFMGLEGVNAFGAVSARFCVIAFAVFAVGIMALGLNRYKRIKYILGLKNPPAHFHRITNTPMFSSMVAVFLLALVVVCFDDWRK